MARNRKRAKERRDRRPQTVAGRARVPAARGDAAEEGSPSPLEHAAPDVELADAQLALGRPELAADPDLAAEAELADEEASIGAVDGDGASDGEAALTVPAPAGAPEARQRPGARLIGFLQGSWRELQRVQWPDRRQVMQATAVVIGFVIVAGIYLGVADTAASHLMNYILTGH